MKKVFLEQLPETKDVDGVKRWEEPKGEFVQVSYHESARHIAFFELKKGYWRGKHYHERKEEIFYVIHGKIRAVFIDLDTDETEEVTLTKGHRLRIEPRCGHVFYGIDDSSVVEYSPQNYDKTDAHKVDIKDKYG
jgi:dTDP-4-dehydrorhamnose 3,5-epimerase-like enzyme